MNYIRNKNLFPLWIIVVVVLLSGCGSKEVVKQYDPAEEFREGINKFQKKDYLEAIDNFKVITLQFQGSQYADAAQYYMGECRFLRKEYILAAYEYEQLLKLMPNSTYCSKAQFQLATSYYKLSPPSHHDQNYTYKAIDAYQAFLEYFPTDSLVSVAEERIREMNTKLAKKDYENGIIYMKMGYYRSAAYYFDIVLSKYHDTYYAEPALLKKAEALYNRKMYSEADETVRMFIEKYTSSSMLKDALSLQSKIKAGIAAALEESKKPKKTEHVSEQLQQKNSSQ